MTDKRPYYDRATSWAIDNQAAAGRSRRTAWTLAGIAVAVALFEAVALAMLAPLKSVQTVTVLVDKQTGYVQAIDPSQPRRILADDALTNAYLAQYVIAREGFDRATVAGDYRKVGLWSAGRAQASYLAMMPATNAASPFQRLPAGTIVEASVKSVSRLSSTAALVRFDTVGVDRSGQRSVPLPWVAIVRYRYVDAPMRLEDRLVNPLGFQVTGYRRDAEAPPPSFAPVAPQPPAVSSMLDPTTTTVVETSRRVERSIPGISPNQTPPRRITPSAMIGPPRSFGDVREVPLSQLPLGSPLSSRPAGSR